MVLFSPALVKKVVKKTEQSAYTNLLLGPDQNINMDRVQRDILSTTFSLFSHPTLCNLPGVLNQGLDDQAEQTFDLILCRKCHKCFVFSKYRETQQNFEHCRHLGC